MRAGFTACVLTLLAATSAGAVEDGCRKFDWPVNREIELFDEGFFADVESESALPKDGAFSMLLKPVGTVMYMVPPERGRDDGYGGIVTLEWIAAGRYQITLSGDAWIDAVQNDRRLPVLASTSRDDCPRHPPERSVRDREPAAHAAVRGRHGASTQRVGAARTREVRHRPLAVARSSDPRHGMTACRALFLAPVGEIPSSGRCNFDNRNHCSSA